MAKTLCQNPKCHSERSEVPDAPSVGISYSRLPDPFRLWRTQGDKFEIVSKNSGFIMVVVIMAVVAVGMVMFVLAADANMMIFQPDTARLKAAQRNLTASALAWARHNIKNTPAESLDKTVNLEAPELDIPAAAVAVTITAPAGKNPQAQITTSATRKRRTLKSQNEYNLAQ